jgi:MFS transporter, BCD family, chlorophyll transporter
MKSTASPASLHVRLARQWGRVGLRFLPFADAVSPGLPWPRLVRLASVQVTVGMAGALLAGTLNRVMIVELGVAAWLVGALLALPLLVAPLRAWVGHRSDTHRSFLGWRRVPYLWFGTLLQFGGLAILPFALLLLSPGGEGRPGALVVGQVCAALGFLMVGAGLQTAQTAALALATDQSPPDKRPRVVALMYVMLLAGVLLSSLLLSALLRDFSPTRLVGVVQGAALATLLLNLAALWKQEARGSAPPPPALPAREGFASVWKRFAAVPHTRRFLVAVGLGTAGFNMQDVVLEPYGAEILHLSVSATSLLTALMALGALAAFVVAEQRLRHGQDPSRLAAMGILVGIAGFASVVFAAPLQSPTVFRAGTALIGFGGGLFSVSMLVLAMARDSGSQAGLALGAWGAVQATGAGLAVVAGGALRDSVHWLARHGALGDAMGQPHVAYSVIYHLEIGLLFATLVAIGPLVRPAGAPMSPAARFGLAELPR